jgi:hypothetical protein
MNPKAQELKTKADQTKALYLAGDATYEQTVEVVTEYINFCNERAVVIAKEFGMKPKKMSVKAYMR